MLEHSGIRWGYVFLHGALHINGDEVRYLMLQAVEMYIGGEEERDVKCSGFEGKLYTERRYEVIGSLGGQRFDAKLETPHGQDQAAFLVSEQSGGVGSFISRN
jgi:hypothetical protein